ncbi:MAG: hypothetical protein BGN96_03890 [Bacteroidales bacterium 45-6]|nr:MAG: hypothetical protein BGN96_03890 [Bacteroidales bacterium 45-6]
MRILHAIFSFHVGGAETMLVDILNHQVEKHEVALVVVNNLYSNCLLSKIDCRVKVFLVGRPAASKNMWYFFKLNKYALWFQPQILHCHDANICKYILPINTMKKVYTVHGPNLPLSGIECYDSVVAISDGVKLDVLDRTAIVSEKLYNGIDVRKISPRESPFASNGSFRIIQIGRLLDEIKGQSLVIRALSLLKQKDLGVEVSIDFIGAGSSESALKEMVAQLGLLDHVRFLGLKDREYIYSHLKEYDLLVQPSLFEGFGLTVVEAMVAGLPVLVSDVEGPMEIIKKGKYGFYFESNNVDDLVRKLVSLIKSPEKRLWMAGLGQQYAMDNFDIAVTVKNYENLYKGLLG